MIVDLSADYRFDDSWYYGLPELTRRHYDGRSRISNPGCYATAMQLAIAPLKAELAAPPSCFGVSRLLRRGHDAVATRTIPTRCATT